MLHRALLVCSVLLLAAVVTGEDQLGFSYKFYPEAVGWLKLHLVPANWAEARLRCSLEGAVLASPLNASLLNAMKEMMANHVHVHCGIYSGIHATISKGDYFSIEGVPLSLIPATWAPNEPDNFEDSESCLMMLANGTMADVKCTDVFPYLCYKKDADKVKNVCGTTDNEYGLDTRTGSCYKLHVIGQTWSRAYMTCGAEGGHLGVVNSAMESQVFKELFEKNRKNIVARNTEEAFIGFHDWDEHGTWRAIHGETLKNAGFASWTTGQPDNWKGEEYCGSIVRNGLLNDNKCHQNLAFICEKKSIYQ